MQGRFVTRIIAVAAAALVLMLPAAAQQQAGADRAAKIKEEAAKPTPRLADGHPDLSGLWTRAQGDGRGRGRQPVSLGCGVQPGAPGQFRGDHFDRRRHGTRGRSVHGRLWVSPECDTVGALCRQSGRPTSFP